MYSADEGLNVPRAILQIGDWVYPLIPGVSPCYRTEYGAFILPNFYAETPGTLYKIRLNVVLTMLICRFIYWNYFTCRYRCRCL